MARSTERCARCRARTRDPRPLVCQVHRDDVLTVTVETWLCPRCEARWQDAGWLARDDRRAWPLLPTTATTSTPTVTATARL